MSDAPMTPDELRTKWALSHPRERDAMVAEAIYGHPTMGGGDDLWEGPGDRLRPLRRYSTAWADAGPLLADLVVDADHGVQLSQFADQWKARMPDDAEAEGDGLPSAIALLYLLAKLKGLL